jgi:hypothetical protein
MACETNLGRIAHLAGRLSAGITRLVSKRAFYAGVAVGAAGTGALTLALNTIRNRRLVQAGRIGPVPIWPDAQLGPAEAIPGTRLQPRPIPGLSDSPRAGTRTKPHPIPGQPASPQAKKRAKTGSGQKPAGARASAKDKSAGVDSTSDRSEPQTRLQPAEIQIQTRAGQPLVIKNGYRVLRPDGTDTGLAVTPHLVENATGQSTEGGDAWLVTHTRTGAFIGDPLGTVAGAHQLATKLAPLPWTGIQMSPADIARARQIVADHLPGEATEPAKTDGG